MGLPFLLSLLVSFTAVMLVMTAASVSALSAAPWGSQGANAANTRRADTVVTGEIVGDIRRAVDWLQPSTSDSSGVYSSIPGVAIGLSNSVLFHTLENGMVVRDVSSGSILWSFNFPSPDVGFTTPVTEVPPTPAVDPVSGNIVVVARDNRLYWLSNAGAYQSGDRVITTSARSTLGIAFVSPSPVVIGSCNTTRTCAFVLDSSSNSTSFAKLYAFESSTGNLLWFVTLGQGFVSPYPPLFDSGVLYFHGNNTIYSIKTATGAVNSVADSGLAESGVLALTPDRSKIVAFGQGSSSNFIILYSLSLSSRTVVTSGMTFTLTFNKLSLATVNISGQHYVVLTGTANSPNTGGYICVINIASLALRFQYFLGVSFVGSTAVDRDGTVIMLEPNSVYLVEITSAAINVANIFPLSTPLSYRSGAIIGAGRRLYIPLSSERLLSAVFCPGYSIERKAFIGTNFDTCPTCSARGLFSNATTDYRQCVGCSSLCPYESSIQLSFELMYGGAASGSDGQPFMQTGYLITKTRGASYYPCTSSNGFPCLLSDRLSYGTEMPGSNDENCDTYTNHIKAAWNAVVLTPWNPQTNMYTCNLTAAAPVGNARSARTNAVFGYQNGYQNTSWPGTGPDENLNWSSYKSFSSNTSGPTTSSASSNTQIQSVAVTSAELVSANEPGVPTSYIAILCLAGGILVLLWVVVAHVPKLRKSGALAKMDLFFQVNHYTPVGFPVIRRRTATGGLFTVAMLVVIFCVVAYLSMTYIMDNEAPNSALVAKVAIADSIPGSNLKFGMRIQIRAIPSDYTEMGNCNPLFFKTIQLPKPAITLFPNLALDVVHNLKSGTTSDLWPQSCHISYYCTDCYINTAAPRTNTMYIPNPFTKGVAFYELQVEIASIPVKSQRTFPATRQSVTRMSAFPTRSSAISPEISFEITEAYYDHYRPQFSYTYLQLDAASLSVDQHYKETYSGSDSQVPAFVFKISTVPAVSYTKVTQATNSPAFAALLLSIIGMILNISQLLIVVFERFTGGTKVFRDAAQRTALWSQFSTLVAPTINDTRLTGLDPKTSTSVEMEFVSPYYMNDADAHRMSVKL